MIWLAVTLCCSGTNLSFRKRAVGHSRVLATSRAAILSYKEREEVKQGPRHRKQNGNMTYRLRHVSQPIGSQNAASPPHS